MPKRIKKVSWNETIIIVVTIHGPQDKHGVAEGLTAFGFSYEKEEGRRGCTTFSIKCEGLKQAARAIAIVS